MWDASQGAAIREARKSKGLTQERLGEMVGVTPQAVSKWEMGESAPDVGTLSRLGDALAISMDQLLRPHPAEDPRVDPLAKALVDWLAEQQQRDGYPTPFDRVLRKLVAVVQDAGANHWTHWRDDFVSWALAARRRPTDVTMVTRQGSVFHWTGADDLPGPDVGDETIANALKFLADPDVIAVLRQLFTEGTTPFDGNARENPVITRLIQEGYFSYHFSADGETSCRQAAVFLLLPWCSCSLRFPA